MDGDETGTRDGIGLDVDVEAGRGGHSGQQHLCTALECDLGYVKSRNGTRVGIQ